MSVASRQMYHNPVTLRAMLLQPFLYLYLRRTPANCGTLRAHSEHTHGTLMAHTQHTVKNGHAGKKRLGYRIMPLMVCRHALIFMVFYSVPCVCHKCAMSVPWVCSVCATFVLRVRLNIKVESHAQFYTPPTSHYKYWKDLCVDAHVVL